MTEVDGVRRGSHTGTGPMPGPVVVRVLTPAVRVGAVERPRPIKPSAVAARLPQGRLDGLRPQVVAATIEPAPRRRIKPPVPAAAPVMPQGSGYIQARRRLVAWGWRRPVIGLAMAVVAFSAAGFVVRLQTSTQGATARAEQTTALAGPSPSPVPTPPKTGLQTILDTFAAANPGLFSVYVKDLNSGDVAHIQADRAMTSASLYKLFVAQRTLAQIDLGELKLEATTGGGTGRSVGACLEIMITVSDNDCGRALGSRLGWGKQNQALSVEGYHETDLVSPQKTSAADVALLLERLYRGTHLSASSNEIFLRLLQSQRVNNRLPQGLPSGTVLAHKTGDLDGYVHDAGIVYGPKTNYVVVVMSGAWKTPGTAPNLFASLSGSLWDYFER